MSAPFPPAPLPAGDDETVALVATQLGLALPAECVAGVRDNLAALAGHWASLRRCVDPAA